MTGLIFTKHVLQRLLERKIRKADIKKTIGYPDKERSGWDDTVIVQKKINNKILRVVYSKKTNKIIIITSYWL